MHPGRKLCPDPLELGTETVHSLDRVGTGLLVDDKAQAGFAVEPGRRDLLGDPPIDISDIPQIDRNPPLVGNDDVPDIIHVLELALGPDGKLAIPALDGPARSIDVLGPENIDDLVRRQPVGIQPVPVENNLDFALALSLDVDRGNTGNLDDLVLEFLVCQLEEEGKRFVSDKAEKHDRNIGCTDTEERRL